MLSFLTAWKTTEEADSKASAVEAASNATKAFEEHLSLLQSSSDVAEQAGKSAVEIQVCSSNIHTRHMFNPACVTSKVPDLYLHIAEAASLPLLAAAESVQFSSQGHSH